MLCIQLAILTAVIEVSACNYSLRVFEIFLDCVAQDQFCSLVETSLPPCGFWLVSNLWLAMGQLVEEGFLHTLDIGKQGQGRPILGNVCSSGNVLIKQETCKKCPNSRVRTLIDSIRGEAAGRSYLALVIPLAFPIGRL